MMHVLKQGFGSAALLAHPTAPRLRGAPPILRVAHSLSRQQSPLASLAAAVSTTVVLVITHYAVVVRSVMCRPAARK